MLEVIGNKVTLSKGDSASFNLTIYYADMEHMYEPKNGDIIRFYLSMKNSLGKNKIVINKPFDKDKLSLKPIDTMYLPSGNYQYEVQITFSNGEVNTIIGPSLFTLTEEVMPYNIGSSLSDNTRHIYFESNIGQLVGVLNKGYEEVLMDEISLNNLTDVEISFPKDGEVISYSEETSKWVNSDLQDIFGEHIFILDGGDVNNY